MNIQTPRPPAHESWEQVRLRISNTTHHLH